MTAPVDVLAVMDRAAGGLYPINFDASLEVIQARAAVAELIEACRPFARPGQVSPELVRLQAALARCGGAA